MDDATRAEWKQKIDVLNLYMEHDDLREKERQESLARLQAERDEAAAMKLTLGQLRQKKHDDLNKAVMKNVHDIVPREIRWLWPGKIPLGKVTLFSGDPDRGKSYVTLDMATRVTRGLDWPGEEEGTMGGGEEGEKEEIAECRLMNAESNASDSAICNLKSAIPTPDSAICNHHSAIHSPGSVILITSEDNGEDTIRPRLDAMHADTRKVEIITHIEREAYSAPFVLTRDLDLLERGIKKLGDCKLVIIDPLASYLELNAGGASSIRQALDPLKSLAERTGVAVILVNHLSKGTGAALHRSLGSISIIGMCRTAWGFTRDKADRSRRFMLPLKNNLSPDDSGFAFSIIDGRVEWESEPVEISIDEAMRGEKQISARKPAAVSEAVEWLKLQLADGSWKPAVDVLQLAREEDFAIRTIHRAKKLLEIESTQPRGGGCWVWRLPQR